MGKSKKFGHAPAPSKLSLDEQITQGRVSKSKGKMKIRLRAEEEMFVDTKSSQKILSAARQQQAEFNIEDDFGPPLVKKSTNPFAQRRNLNKLDNSDSESGDEQPDVDEQDFFDDIKLTEEDARAMEMFQNKDGQRTRKLADVILEKISEKQTEIHTQLSDVGSLKIEELDPRVREMYEGVRDVMKKYRSGKVPKAFKIIPKLRNWEQILFITEPHNWSAAAMYQGTRIFASILAQHMAQRFYNLVLLPRIRDDLSEYRKLNAHLYNAMRKALFKPAAFMKGIILPLLESGDCTLREAIIFGSVIARNQIPVLHSSACLLKICEMEYNGANSIFIRIFLDKRYALPYRVVDATVFHFIRFENDKREMPVLWHQSLLTFVQRYKNDISSEQKEALFALLRKQQHPKLTPEIRRELQAAKCRDVEMMEPTQNLGPMPMGDDTLPDYGIGEDDVNMQA
ncbi:Bystin [Pseudolycoriella hygida]|uniref:Bystin n=1 Tax=Pseudolycoriella hygida TaxID=35572 RepID=A0A9Q0MKL5_9DIPT|nr:Bystin [Pseudolycoriella hygida]